MWGRWAEWQTDRGKLPQNDIERGQQIALANPDAALARWVEQNHVDFGTQDCYTRSPWAPKKCLILLGFYDWRGNPSLSASCSTETKIQQNKADPEIGLRSTLVEPAATVAEAQV